MGTSSLCTGPCVVVLVVVALARGVGSWLGIGEASWKTRLRGRLAGFAYCTVREFEEGLEYS
jgi:hypothetical protein